MNNQQKRSVIDCQQHILNPKYQNGRRNLSSQNSQSTKSQQEEKIQPRKAQENPIFRVTLKDDYKLNEIQQDICSPYFDNQAQIKNKKNGSLSSYRASQSQQQLNSKTFYNWMSNSYTNFDNLEPSNNFEQLKQQNQINQDTVSYKQVSTGSCHKVIKFQSLNNIESQNTNKSNSYTQDNFSLLSNKGRYIVHQKVKKSTESSSELPSTFFTTPQYKTSKTSFNSLQNLIMDKSDQEQKPGIFYASNSFGNQNNMYKVNMKNDKIFAQFVPCFTFSSQNKHRQASQAQAQQNLTGIQQKSQTSIGQSRSSQNIQEQKEENKPNIFKSSQNLDYEQQKKNILFQQNKIQYKFDLLNNLFTKSTLIQGKSLNNDLKKFNQTNGFQNRKQLDTKQSNLFRNSSQQEQIDSFQVPQLSSLQSDIEKTQIILNNIPDKNGLLSTATPTEQPDSSLSQDEILLKQSNAFNSKEINFIDRVKSTENDQNQKSQLQSLEENKIFNRYDWTIQNNQNKLINQNIQQKVDSENQNQKLQRQKPFNRHGSLQFLDEQENSTQFNKQGKSYNVSSYTKLPSQCKIGNLNKQNINQNNQFKSAQDIQPQKEDFQVDEKKMMEDYRQYLLRKKLDIKSKCVAVYDLDKKEFVLRIKGQKLSQIASITKIMTCYIVCDLLNKYDFKRNDEIKLTLKKDQIITVSKIASKMIGTSALLRHGDQLTLWDLLHGLMLPSGNDAAFAISEHVGSLIYESSPIFQQKKYQNPKLVSCNPKAGQKEFIKVMNQYAQKLKLQKTFYQNPHGLTNSKNKSCADDICILISHAMKNQYFREIVKTIEYTAKISNSRKGSREQTWENTNKLLKSSCYCIGVKTGITPAAGACLSSCFSINNRNFVIVILNTLTLEMRFTETIQIFKFLVDIYQLDKQSSNILKEGFDYQPDQANIIENKYTKNGRQITSSSNFQSNNDLELKDESDSQDDFQDEDEEDEENSDQEDDSQKVSANSFSKRIKNKDNESDSEEQLSINDISEIKQNIDRKSIKSNNYSSNSIKSGENLIDNNQKQAQKQQIFTDDDVINKKILKNHKNSETEQNNEFNNLIRQNITSQQSQIQNSFDQQERNQELVRHSRSKKLSKIQEEEN
ncbi:D-alanyl-D-alanine carboxypeptidase family protein (macronuclear) [Tetrahymena thermophila SB210]|uniref:D-alanyl-D-alanine carboxypeptidase family protein n=1 Tax=Tetrahymena thermophila (strain SB210) TaxID=312017 RepID=I7MJ79_TETTS|nr:D-alanyl-D-alanine carboxypeptidase family protein [Tetrahymena thermophila SB210]EAS05970.2 D-alanyl-D-alanine carboxypeptidase family protein [Tetrahymena thermophila SB210]|eukprot:XP_001026215.2 D-alanyl-D-alanine carboxypeptidase family protein [Tetrahymena thermophila SB210]